MKTKLPLLVTAVILLAGGAIYWNQRARLSAEMESRNRAASSLEERGVATNGKERRSRLRPGEDPKMGSEAVRQLTLELADLAARNAGDKRLLSDEERAANAKRMGEIYAQIMDLGFGEQLLVMQTISESEDLDRIARWEILSAIAPGMARKDPEGLLDFLIKDSDSLHEINLGVFHQLWIPALVSLAQKDVDTAMRYFRQYDDSKGGPLEAQDWGSIIHSLAEVDPVAAYGMAKQLGGAEAYIGNVLALKLRGKPEALRSEALGLMRSQGDEALRRQFLEATGRYLTDKSFAETRPWLERSGLTDAELAIMIGGVEPAKSTHKDTGEWLEWTMSRAPEVAVTKVTGTMEGWTKSDYKAAGEWLVGLPEGPLKHAAVLGYAGAAAPYDPEGAAEWVATLPIGLERRGLAQKVLENWQDESGAKSSFARREGIAP